MMFFKIEGNSKKRFVMEFLTLAFSIFAVESINAANFNTGEIMAWYILAFTLGIWLCVLINRRYRTQEQSKKHWNIALKNMLIFFVLSSIGFLFLGVSEGWLFLGIVFWIAYASTWYALNRETIGKLEKDENKIEYLL